MERALKIIKIITIISIIILISIIAFFGIYVKQNNVWKNIISEFNYGIELDGARELRYVLDTTEEEKNVYVDEEGNIVGEVKEEEESTEVTEEATENVEESDKSEEKPNYATETRKIKANEDEVKTIENYEKAKKIIQKRLENEDVYEYNMRLDSVTGELIIEVADDDTVSIAHTAITSIGKFEFIDDQTGIILMDRSDIKEVKAGAYQAETGYQACLQIYFNKEGAEKLKEISNKYREVVNDAGESTTYYVAVNLDGQTLLRTSFPEEFANGVIQLPIGEPSTDSVTINETLKDVRRIADIIDEEKLPIAYTLNSDIFVQSKITSENIKVALIVFAAVVLVISIIFIVKFKTKGLMASILGVGYIAILTIIARYTGLYVTLNSIITFVCVVILNYIFMALLLLELNKNNIKEAFLKTTKKYYITIIPVCIIAIIFTFVSNVTISSIGMILFWGLLVQAIYNTVTMYVLDLI